MSDRLVEIKAQLLEARKEAERDLNTIDKALDAIGVQREQPKQQQRHRTRESRAEEYRRRPVSQERIDQIMRVLEGSEQPLRTAEVAERVRQRKDMVGKALSWLVREGKIRQAGTAPGRGKIPIYAPVKKGEIGEALKPPERPRPQITRIEDEQHRLPSRQ